MNQKIRLRSGVKIEQPLTHIPWETGEILGFCRASDDRCYAIVKTEHGEFEYVMLNQMIAI